MKKSKIVPALVLASTFLLAACGPEQEPPCSHVDENHDQVCDNCGEAVVTAHTFDQTTVKNENTLKEEANCLHGNIYFKTCECGAIATSETDTWEDTSTKLEHVDADHDQKCDNCEVDVVTTHTFDQTTVKDQTTLKEAANCEHGNIYYKTCECGAIATSETDTWEDTSTKLEHVDTDPVDHVCDLCETTIGTHVFDQTTVKDETTLATEADCTHGDIYFKTCVCGEVSTSQTDTWEDTSTKLEHVDADKDLECDNCQAELEGIGKITINMPVDRISIGESTTLSAEILTRGDYLGAVSWSLKTETTKLSLVDNENNTCTLTGLTGLTSSSVSSFTIRATSDDDETIYKEVTFYASCFPTARVSAIASFVGADYVLPYCNFKAVGNFKTIEDWTTNTTYVKGYTENSTDYINVIKAFDNNGTYTKSVEGSHTYFTKHIEGTNYDVQYDIYLDDSNRSTVDVYKIPTPFNSFPTEAIASLVSEIGATGTVPAFNDGSGFVVLDDTGYDAPGVVVTVDNAEDALIAYKQILENAGWFVNSTSGYDVYYGFEGKTLIINPYVNGGKLVIDFYKNPTPVAKPLTEWPAQRVADALVLAEETAVGAEGTVFKVTSESENRIVLEVTGSDTAYMAALESASYTKDATSPYHPVFTSPTGTIKITVDIDYFTEGQFTVTLVSQLPAGVSLEFPLNEVKAIITGDEAADVIGTTGTRFTLTENDDYDVTIKVEGGDKTSFETALGVAGFNSAIAGCFSKGNLCCDTQTVDGGFTINYYLAEPPAKKSWSLVNQALLEGFYDEKKVLPEPTTYTDFELQDTGWYLDITIYGTTLFDYRQDILAAGGTCGSTGAIRTGSVNGISFTIQNVDGGVLVEVSW